MIKVYYHKIAISHNLQFESLLSLVPYAIKEKVLKYHFISDRMRGLIGKLLLKKALTDAGYSANVLDLIKNDQFNRPYIDKNIDFNIAHSGCYVICAISKDSRVGIDIEEIKNIDLSEFDNVLSTKEMNEIRNNKSPLNLFYSIWVQKEAAIKANGKGLGISLNDILIDNQSVLCEKETWSLKKLDIHQCYVSYLVFKGNLKVFKKELKIIDFF